MIKIKLISLFLLLPLLCTQGCNPAPGGEQYNASMRDLKNGLHVMHRQGEYIFDVQYQPSEFVSAQRHGSFDATIFKNEKQELDQIQYYTLNINSLDDGKNVVEHISGDDKDRAKTLNYYFSYRFQDHIFVTANNSKWPCVLYHYEQYGKQTFVLGFERPPEIEKEVTLHIESDVLQDKPIEIKISTHLPAI